MIISIIIRFMLASITALFEDLLNQNITEAIIEMSQNLWGYLNRLP